MNELTRRDFVRGGLTAGIGIGIAPELLRSAVARQAAPAPAAGADPYALVDPELLAAIKQFPHSELHQRKSRCSTQMAGGASATFAGAAAI